MSEYKYNITRQKVVKKYIIDDKHHDKILFNEVLIKKIYLYKPIDFELVKFVYIPLIFEYRIYGTYKLKKTDYYVGNNKYYAMKIFNDLLKANV